nr:RNase adapter RapZ [Bacillus subtilis]WGE08261.1 RNase adapter RapZ [Bacillus subtilis]
MKWNETQKFNEKLIDLLSFMLPSYKREGKSQVVIAIGCTGVPAPFCDISREFS